MKLYLLIFLGLITAPAFAQSERTGRKYLYEGNTFYEKGNYGESQKKYEDAIRLSPDNAFALYNLANTYYRTEKFEEAINFYESYLNRIDDEKIRSRGYHNMGNAYLMMNELEKSIDAYKDALRLAPEDEDTRYNLAYAQKKLQQQQEQDQNKEQENQEQNGNENNRENNEENQNNDQNQNQESQKKNNQQQNVNAKMTREQAEKLLNLLNSEEKQVQDALLKRNKQKSSHSSSGKQW